MNALYLDKIGFMKATTVIVVTGSRLSKYGNMMIDMLACWKIFIMGIILLASVTSMPKLMNGISSVVFLDAPNFAVGDIVKSCAFNILIISIIDLFYDHKKTLTSVAQAGLSFGIILLSLVAFAILMPAFFGTILWIGEFSILFLLFYFIAIRVVFLYDIKENNHRECTRKVPFFSLRVPIILYLSLAPLLLRQ